MNCIYRDGFDVDVALAAAYRRALPLASVAPAGTCANEQGEPGQADQHSAPLARRSMRATLKPLLRAPVKAAYKLLRPFLRPLAFRIRAYLTLLVRQDLQHARESSLQDIERMSGQMLREVQSARESLRHDLLALPQQSPLEQRHLLVSVLQEIQSTRDASRRDLRDQLQAVTRPLDDVQRMIVSQLQAQRAMLDELQAHRALLDQVPAQRALLDQLQARSAAFDHVQAHRALLDEMQAQRDTLQVLRADVGALQADAGATRALDGLRSDLLPRLDRIEQYGYATARRVFVNCANDEVMVRTEAGMVLCSNTDVSVLACLIDSGDLERGTRLLIERLLKPGEVFVDVGANLGLHTLAAARALHGQGRVIAFEPFEGTRRLLEKSVWLNGYSDTVDVHAVALSDHDATLPLFIGASSGHHSLFDFGAGDGAHVEVATRTLDAMLDPGLPVSLIKIDVEGAELQVIGGAGAVLAAHPALALIVEFGPAHLHRSGTSTTDWLAAFTAHGFVYRAIEAMSGTLREVSHAELEAAESTNLLFARPQSPAWQRAGALP